MFFNRVASFFVYLDEPIAENMTDDAGGETWFPYIEIKGEGADGERKWRKHEEDGTAFRPRRGNGVFWVNLHANGTGDWRVQHAGLPLGDGMKTAMNIWPRRFYEGRQV